jgi:hypothetical protein
MQGFESWGQARAHLEALAPGQAKATSPKLSRRQIVEGSSPLGKDLLNLGHAAFFLRHDEEVDPLIAVLEWAQAEIWQKPDTIQISRPTSPDMLLLKHQARQLANTISERTGQAFGEEREDLYDKVMDEFCRTDLHSPRTKSPIVISLPWIPGDQRLAPALTAMKKRGVYAVLRACRRDYDAASQEDLDTLLQACDLWTIAPGLTLPGLRDCHGGQLRNEDDHPMAFDRYEVKRLFTSPDYTGLLDDPTYPDEEHELTVALRCIELG